MSKLSQKDEERKEILHESVNNIIIMTVRISLIV